MTLYEIPQAMEDCETVDEETGEIFIDESRLDMLQMAYDEKVENIALWIKDLDAEAEAIKQEKLALEKRQKAAENKSRTLKRYLTNNMINPKFSTPRVSISFRKSTSVEVDDIFKLPDDYLNYAEPTVRKNELKKAMQLGFEFPEAGARLVEKQNIQIK